MPKIRKILCGLDAPYIQALVKLIEAQKKSVLAHWAVEYSAKVILPLWSRRFPDDQRPRDALNGAREWLSGGIRLPQAKKLILECHAAAREAGGDPAAQAAARAIGQCSSVIHSARHCTGIVLYGALAVAYDTAGTDAPWRQIERYAIEECARMEDSLQAYIAEAPVCSGNDTH